MVINGVLRTVWVNIPHRVRFMDVLFKTAPKEMLAFRRVRKRAVLKTIFSRVLQHAALTGINGSLAEINVESPACGARSKTTIVRKHQWSKLFFEHYYPRAKRKYPRGKVPPEPTKARQSFFQRCLALDLGFQFIRCMPSLKRPHITGC